MIMPYPKRLPLRRMQVQWRQPNTFERGPLGKDFRVLRWAARFDEGEDGAVILQLTSRARLTRGDILQAVICMVLREDPDATIADLCDLAGCSRETAHRRKLAAYRINAAFDAEVAARRAVARRRPSRVLSSSP
jgi:hypothetical protein